MYQLRYANSPIASGEHLIYAICDADLHARHRNFEGIYCDRQLAILFRLCDICGTDLKDGESNPHQICMNLKAKLDNL